MKTKEEVKGMSSCFFCKMDRCVYRNRLTKATKDCEFMGEDGSCNAKESDLIDYDGWDFDPDFGLKHLSHLEKIIKENKK